jgi:FkbM family methyltransferase
MSINSNEILNKIFLTNLKIIFRKIFPKYFNKSYSQEGEDMILKRIFENKKNGFFIDIGAHHPKKFSNTFFFYLKGWNGINIDAMPGSMKIFKKTRKNDINLEIPISENKQILTYFAFNEPALNSFDEELSIKRLSNSNYHLKFKKHIETSRLEDVLDKYLPLNTTIDFLTIDVEGLDFQVLKSLNLKKYKPNIILIEILDSNFNNLFTNEISLFLFENDYEIIAKSVNTVFFKKISIK